MAEKLLARKLTHDTVSLELGLISVSSLNGFARKKLTHTTVLLELVLIQLERFRMHLQLKGKGLDCNCRSQHTLKIHNNTAGTSKGKSHLLESRPRLLLLEEQVASG